MQGSPHQEQLCGDSTTLYFKDEDKYQSYIENSFARQVNLDILAVYSGQDAPSEEEKQQIEQKCQQLGAKVVEAFQQGANRAQDAQSTTDNASEGGREVKIDDRFKMQVKKDLKEDGQISLQYKILMQRIKIIVPPPVPGPDHEPLPGPGPNQNPQQDNQGEQQENQNAFAKFFSECWKAIRNLNCRGKGQNFNDNQ